MTSERQTAEIKRRVATGLLPHLNRSRTYGGRSLGGTCDACGMEIARNALEFDVDLLDGTGSLLRTVTVHTHCHQVWLQVSRESPRRQGEAQAERRPEPAAEPQGVSGSRP